MPDSTSGSGADVSEYRGADDSEYEGADDTHYRFAECSNCKETGSILSKRTLPRYNNANVLMPSRLVKISSWCKLMHLELPKIWPVSIT